MIQSSMEPAKYLFEYLAVKDPECVSANLIIGFGHFDLRIASLCGCLYKKGFGDKILFTGGRGSGTADLQEAEGIVFRNVLFSEYPDIPETDVIVESNSTNTGENIRFSEEVLKSADSNFCFEKGIKSIIAVASPYRQRRVWRTLQKLYPEIRIYNKPVETDFETEVKLFKEKNEDFAQLILGEMERIVNYPDKGYMNYELIPAMIFEAYGRLKIMLS